MNKFDMIDFQKLFKLDDQNKLKKSLYENLSNNEKRVLYDEVINQKSKSINLKSKALYYLIFAVVQMLFLISMILLLVIGVNYNDHMTSSDVLLFYILPILSISLTTIVLFFTVIIYLCTDESFEDDIDDVIILISFFSSISLTFLITKTIILILQIFDSVILTIKREIGLNSNIVKDQADHYENKFINYFHQVYYTQNKTAYFKHEIINKMYTCDDKNELKFNLLSEIIDESNFTEVEIDALNRLLHQQKERQLNFQQLIKKLHQLSILTLLKDSKNNQIKNEKEAKIIYNQQQQYEEKVQQAMKQLKNNQLNSNEVIDQQFKNISS